jgi:hypothetical protein
LNDVYNRACRWLKNGTEFGQRKRFSFSDGTEKRSWLFRNQGGIPSIIV